MPYTRAGLPFAAQSDTSYEAALKARKFVAAQGLRVWRWLREVCVPSGGTQKEAAEALNMGRPSLCARFKALEDAGAIVKTAYRRDGCAVYGACVGDQPSQGGFW